VRVIDHAGVRRGARADLRAVPRGFAAAAPRAGLGLAIARGFARRTAAASRRVARGRRTFVLVLRPSGGGARLSPARACSSSTTSSRSCARCGRLSGALRGRHGGHRRVGARGRRDAAPDAVILDLVLPTARDRRLPRAAHVDVLPVILLRRWRGAEKVAGSTRGRRLRHQAGRIDELLRACAVLRRTVPPASR